MNKELFDFIKCSPTPFHAVKNVEETLEKAGFIPLCESEKWKLEKGKNYYVTRNGSSVIAFKVPKDGFCGFMMTASHCDSPTFKIKENPELADKHYVRLSTEKYGGMLCSTWLDRPLSVAGRIMVKTEKGVSMRLVDLKKPCAVIPNVAIHMNRNANDGVSYNPAVDMLPLYSDGEGGLRRRIAENAGVEESDILATDIIVYNPQEGTEWNGFISAPRLDDLQCAFSALTAFISAEKNTSSCRFIAFLTMRRSEARQSRAQLPHSLPIPSTAFAKPSEWALKIITALLPTAFLYPVTMRMQFIPTTRNLWTKTTREI